MTRLVIFDYGAGNLHSLVKAIAADDRNISIEPDLRSAMKADVLVLPGVGAFGAAASAMRSAQADLSSALADGLPCLGICLGMQTMVIEFARNVCALPRAHSTEFDPATPDRVIYKLRELKGIERPLRFRRR